MDPDLLRRSKDTRMTPAEAPAFIFHVMLQTRWYAAEHLELLCNALRYWPDEVLANPALRAILENAKKQADQQGAKVPPAPAKDML